MVTQAMINEAMRYIGMPQRSSKIYSLIEHEEMEVQVKKGFNLLEKIAESRVIYQKFDVTCDKESVKLEGTSCQILSKDLVKLLAHSKQCVMMAATLGMEVDRQIGLKQRVDMLEAVVLDACASVLIDKVCDDIESELISNLEPNQNLTMRFSPGYGDVPLEASEDFLDILMAPKKIGLTLTHSQMLVPTKSITAIIGLSSQKENRQKSCGNCNLVKTCAYRKRGEQCGL